MNAFRISILYVLLVALAFSCQGGAGAKDNNTKEAPKDTLTVYTSRYYQEDLELFKVFQERYNTAVVAVQASSKELLERLEAEKGAPKADVVLLDDLSHIQQAKAKGLLQPFSSPGIEQNIASQYTDNEGYWVGITKNFMGIVYRKENVDPAQLTSYKSVTARQWQGQALLPNAETPVFKSFLANMAAEKGAKAVEGWLDAYRNNAVEQRTYSNAEIIETLAIGKAKIGLLDAASLLQYQISGNPEHYKNGEKVGFIFPQNEQGLTYFSINGIGVINNTPNWRDALLFIEYLSDTAVQEQYNNAVRAYSVNAMALPSDFLIDLGGFREAKPDYKALAAQWETVEQLLKDTGWTEK